MPRNQDAPNSNGGGAPVPPPFDPRKLRVVPLGGLGEFGKNMMTMEYGEDMIVIDCGQMFPDAEMLGVDSVIPDFTYVRERVDKLRGLILTHGHEDHIGALPYFMREFDTPIYGSRLTLAISKGKLAEMGLEDRCEYKEIRARSRVKLGAFDIEFLQVTHSIPESMALAITLPIGTVVHTGDYKFDSSEDEMSDFFTLSRYGESGVLALFGDSTNVDREGYSPSEKSVQEALIPIIATAPAGVILTTFGSGLHRVQTALNIAQLLGRKIFLGGLSVERNFAIATKLGLLHYPEDLVMPIREINKVNPKKRL
ncbi:ribonuclease J, partial [Candidatus Sumerlaeota bacterium]|nr:ribonuclease J [Candidatus Sumerlaeota bacterium]